MSNLAQVDYNLSYTPKRLVYISGYGNIKTLQTDTIKDVYNHYNRVQPLFGKFGEHLPLNTVMENSQTTLAWDNTIKHGNVNINNKFINQNLEQLNAINSQLPINSQVNKTLLSSSSKIPTPTTYYSINGEYTTTN
jgi:hypothetical protein